jgi:hypothetical protein
MNEKVEEKKKSHKKRSKQGGVHEVRTQGFQSVRHIAHAECAGPGEVGENIEKQKEKKRKKKRENNQKQGDKGNNSTPFPALSRTDAIIRPIFCCGFFFSPPWTSSAPMCLHRRTVGDPSPCVCPLAIYQTLKNEKGNPSCRAPMIQFPTCKCPDAKPNQDQCGQGSNQKDSGRRMYVLYMQ